MSAISETSDCFGPPVVLYLGPASNIRHRVNSSMDAANLLLDEWPEPRGAAYFAACKASIAALEGKTSASAVRTALIAAAREAGVLSEFVPPSSGYDRGRRPAG